MYRFYMFSLDVAPEWDTQTAQAVPEFNLHLVAASHLGSVH